MGRIATVPFETDISASLYDQNAFAQKRCAKELVKMLQIEDVKSFIDIGTGTGLVAVEVLDKFPTAKPLLLDKSSKMLKIAQLKMPNASIVNVDAEMFDVLNHYFDLAIANLSVQWFNDFETFLKRILISAKYFAFSIPLKGSFNRYFDIFKNIELPNIMLYTKSEILDIIQQNATVIQSKQFTITKTYKNAIEATRHFRNIGATFSVNKQIQAQIAARIKTYTTPIPINYKLFLCYVSNQKKIA